MTASAFHKLCTLVKCDQPQETTPQQEPSAGVAQLQLDMQTPFVPYASSVLEEIPQDILPLKGERSAVSPTDKGIIEPAQNQSRDNSSMEETTACKDTIDC
ncbi:PREDICTED: uncharacterized protein LOC105566220 [Vollenhovia emeryi]|uniref:uncharacterized protein LOC105566220 n=1 Tax=Vollenhovia emeryi TaxID=411798 RepID=UPI0005F47AD3|nr:PREDICTED: uncharacterized protein LOC105566220 [Vollenhovia emeryi]